MRALTLTCPWGPAIAYWGKGIENRTWEPPDALLGQRIAIHAGKSPWRVGRDGKGRISEETLDDVSDAMEFIRHAAREGVVPEEVNGRWLHERSSAVLSVVTLAGWFRSPSVWRTADQLPPRISELVSPFFVGPVGWILRERVALPTPVPCKGAQGLWTLPPDVERQVLAEELRAREADARAAGGAP